MDERYLFDTNICIHIINRREFMRVPRLPVENWLDG